MKNGHKKSVGEKRKNNYKDDLYFNYSSKEGEELSD